MTPVLFISLWRAELNKLLTRLSARMGLVLAVILGLVGPLAMWWATHSDAQINNQALGSMFEATAPLALQWSLEVRNFFFMRAVLIMVGAVMLAGELKAGTLREDILRPVPRWSIISAKWLAMVSWLALTLLFTWLIAAVLSTILFGIGGDWLPPLQGYALTLACDAGFGAMVLLIGILVRSVAATVAGVFLFLVMDTLLGWVLKMVAWVGKMMESMGGSLDLPVLLQAAVKAQPWLPSSAFAVWRDYGADTHVGWESYAALVLITVTSLGLAKLVFHRMDVH